MKSNKKILSFSGAATDIVSHIAHCENLIDEGFSPNIIAGVSSGNLAAIAFAFNKVKEAKKMSLELNYEDIFGDIPVNSKGKISSAGYFRGVFKGNFGDSKGLEQTLRDFISIEEFEDFVKKDKIQLYAGVTNVSLEKFELINLNECNYDLFIKFSVASATIPLYCDPIKINDYYYWDGGLMQHNPGEFLIKQYNSDIEKLVSVYSRPEKKDDIPNWNFKGNSLGRNLSASFNLMTDSISFSNQKAELDLKKIYKYDLDQRFMPKKILLSVYDINKKRLKESYDSIRKKIKT